MQMIEEEDETESDKINVVPLADLSLFFGDVQTHNNISVCLYRDQAENLSSTTLLRSSRTSVIP